MFKKIYTATLTTAKVVIPAKAGIQRNTGFPRIKYGASLVKPGMTERIGFISACMKIDLAAVTFGLHRLLLAVTIWSCHVWVAPTYRLSHVLAAEPRPQGEALKLRFLSPKPRSRNKFGMTKRAETNSHAMLNPESVMPNAQSVMPNAQSVMPNLFRHPVCFFSAFSRRGLNKPSTPRTLGPSNPSGFTLIELIVVMIIIGILAATVLPRIDFGSTSSSASVNGAAYMIASDIRYTQEWAMATRTSRTIGFTSTSSSYTSPVTGSLVYLPSGATISNDFSVTFNSLGEPIATTPVGTWSVGVSAGGVPKTITVVNYTGKANIS